MKTTNYLSLGIALLVSTLSVAKVNAQSIKSLDSTKKALQLLLDSKNPEDSVKVMADAKRLANGTENQMVLACHVYYSKGFQHQVDSIQDAMPKRFPLGVSARDIARKTIYNDTVGKVAEADYDAWIKKFPPSHFIDYDYDHIDYDYARAHIADLYAEEKNFTRAKYFANLEEEDFWRTNGWGRLADIFKEKGDQKDYEDYLWKSMKIAEKYYYDKNSDNAGKFAASGYPGFLRHWAQMLYDKKEYAKALPYIEKSAKIEEEMSISTHFLYAQILEKLNREKDAFEQMEIIVKAGKATPEIQEAFKASYVKIHGSEKGYDAYAVELRKGFLADLDNRLHKDIMDVKATDFTLTDLDGNKVTLSDYKGKIVILDFWATWCGPCKASFPAMQMTLNKYKDDPNVKFFFIHTWEHDANATEMARNYIKSKGYTFHVLMDLKDPVTKDNKVVDEYKADGIPAKYIVDGNGIIRFHLQGFTESNEAAVDEISAMIEMAKKKSAVTSN
jgi:peroxiredoxin